jgi:hypothetical protein
MSEILVEVKEKIHQGILGIVSPNRGFVTMTVIQFLNILPLSKL